MAARAAEPDVTSYTAHFAKVGRLSFIAVTSLAASYLTLQTGAQQGALLERLWAGLGFTPGKAFPGSSSRPTGAGPEGATARRTPTPRLASEAPSPRLHAAPGWRNMRVATAAA